MTALDPDDFAYADAQEPAPEPYAFDPDWPHAYPCDRCGGNGCRVCRGTGERLDTGVTW